MKINSSKLSCAIDNLIADAVYGGDGNYELSDSIRISIEEWDDCIEMNSINVEIKREDEEWEVYYTIDFSEILGSFYDIMTERIDIFEAIYDSIEEVVEDIETNVQGEE